MPGIRAIRNVRKEKGRQHQNAAMDGRSTGSTAAQSGGEVQGQDSVAGEKEPYQVKKWM